MNDQHRYLNLIEPQSWPRLFLKNPPLGFEAGLSPSDLPWFKTGFSLLTTLDPGLRKRLEKTPLFKYWSGLLNWSACFWGTTITEYAPLPQTVTPDQAVAEILGRAGGSSLTIIKDLPTSSPLLPSWDNQYTQKLVEAGLKRGFFELSGQALAYVPIDFADSDEYLRRLSSGRRKDLRRKLKSAAKLSIEVLELGDSLLAEPAVQDEFYEMYLAVFQQSEIHFDLLSPDFFKTLLGGHFASGLAVIYRQEQTIVGYNICLTQGDCLIDKYIGFRYPLARQLNLYFVSWLYNLDLALGRGFKYYVAGWTDPEVKASLGASFTFTRHLVWIKTPLLRKVMQPLRHLFEADRKAVEAL